MVQRLLEMSLSRAKLEDLVKDLLTFDGPVEKGFEGCQTF